jgi:hypothetical protein
MPLTFIVQEEGLGALDFQMKRLPARILTEMFSGLTACYCDPAWHTQLVSI